MQSDENPFEFFDDFPIFEGNFLRSSFLIYELNFHIGRNRTETFFLIKKRKTKIIAIGNPFILKTCWKTVFMNLKNKRFVVKKKVIEAFFIISLDPSFFLPIALCYTTNLELRIRFLWKADGSGMNFFFLLLLYFFLEGEVWMQQFVPAWFIMSTTRFYIF